MENIGIELDATPLPICDDIRGFARITAAKIMVSLQTYNDLRFAQLQIFSS
jgi:hypothetical protein